MRGISDTRDGSAGRTAPVTGTGMRGSGDGPGGEVRPPVVVLAGRRAALVPAAALGALCIVAGGLLAAASAPMPSEKASWAAAYLVLVGGVAQIGFGLGQATYHASASTRSVLAHLVGWNLGNALVMAGTLAGLTALTDVGGALLVAALLLLAPGLRSARGPVRRSIPWLLWGYRAVVLLLLISIPVGLVLARLRA